LTENGAASFLCPCVIAAMRCGSGKRNAGRRDAPPEREGTLSDCLDFFQRQGGTRLRTLKTKKDSQYGAIMALCLHSAAWASGKLTPAKRERELWPPAENGEEFQ
jgi:hypothetical protein